VRDRCRIKGIGVQVLRSEVVRLIDAYGRCFPVQVSEEGGELMLDLTDYPSGLYFLQITAGNHSFVVKIQKL
jgi:hypothetical protein